MKPRQFLLPLVALSIALLIACGGDKKDSASASGQNGGGTSSSTQASSSGANGTLDLSKAGQKLADLKSFKFDMSMKLNAGSAATPSSSSSSQDDAFAGLILGLLTDVKAEGSFVSPDKTSVKVKVAGQDVELIQIAEKSWIKFGGTWQAGDPADSLSSSGSPADLFSDILPGDVLKGAKTSQETVNGAKATRYAFDKAAIEKLAKDSGEDTSDFKDIDKADLSFWMNGDGVPVKITMVVNGKDEKGAKVSMDLQMNIKDINSNITIKAPI